MVEKIRCIHYFEILKLEVYSLFWDFSSCQFHHIRTYTEREHHIRTPQSHRHTSFTSYDKSHSRSGHASINENAEIFLCNSFNERDLKENQNAGLSKRFFATSSPPKKNQANSLPLGKGGGLVLDPLHKRDFSSKTPNFSKPARFGIFPARFACDVFNSVSLGAGSW